MLKKGGKGSLRTPEPGSRSTGWRRRRLRSARLERGRVSMCLLLIFLDEASVVVVEMRIRVRKPSKLPHRKHWRRSSSKRGCLGCSVHVLRTRSSSTIFSLLSFPSPTQRLPPCPFSTLLPSLALFTHSPLSYPQESIPSHKKGEYPLTPANATAFNTLLFSCAVKASYVFLSAPPIVPGSGCRGGGPRDRAGTGVRLGGIVVGWCSWVLGGMGMEKEV